MRTKKKLKKRRRKGGEYLRRENIGVKKTTQEVWLFFPKEGVKIKENGVAKKGGSVKKRKVELRFRLTFS